MSSRWMYKFRQGQADYVTFRPRPAEPSEEQMRSSAGARYFGWMIARSREVGKVMDFLKLVGVDQREDYDRVLTRHVDQIDRAHGLIPPNLHRLV